MVDNAVAACDLCLRRYDPDRQRERTERFTRQAAPKMDEFIQLEQETDRTGGMEGLVDFIVDWRGELDGYMAGLRAEA